MNGTSSVSSTRSSPEIRRARFNKHPKLEGTHALLSASNHHWVNYDLQKMEARYNTIMAAQRGTDMHDLAHRCIKLGVRLPEVPETINLYVNDAIDYGMTPEQPLYYSDNCFGTADAIGFDGDILRIHDLKTGIVHTSERQLYIYAAYFCLEYEIDPEDINIELRIYQSDEVRVYEAEIETVRYIIEKTVLFNQHIEKWRLEA